MSSTGAHAAGLAVHEQGDEVRDPVLSIRDLTIEYRGGDTVRAVDHVSLDVGRGEIVGLAGESGCGKSTLAYSVMQLLRPPAVVVGGELVFHGGRDDAVDIRHLSGDRLRRFRWSEVAMVFQGAMNSLNPVMRIEDQITDAIDAHQRGLSRQAKRTRVEELLRLVGVPTNRISAYPHELSGGMRQRVMIAMALALQPELLIMDEPTTALDVVVQRDILNEIIRLRDEIGFAVLFITHDLPLLLEISDRIAVMREGRILELARAEDLYWTPQHEYTRKLLSSFPSLTGSGGAQVRGDE